MEEGKKSLKPQNCIFPLKEAETGGIAGKSDELERKEGGGDVAAGEGEGWQRDDGRQARSHRGVDQKDKGERRWGGCKIGGLD